MIISTWRGLKEVNYFSQKCKENKKNIWSIKEK